MNEQTKKKAGEERTLFDAQKDGSDVAPKWVAPEDEQEPYESRRLWRDLTRAVLAKDMDAATESKTAVENAQRELRATGVKHATRFFELQDGRWVPRIQCVALPPRPLIT
jgi:oxysterol-binding protein-related protein 8